MTLAELLPAAITAALAHLRAELRRAEQARLLAPAARRVPAPPHLVSIAPSGQPAAVQPEGEHHDHSR